MLEVVIGQGGQMHAAGAVAANLWHTDLCYQRTFGERARETCNNLKRVAVLLMGVTHSP